MMQLVLSYSLLYADICVIYATLSLSYFILSRQSAFSWDSRPWKRFAFGLFSGLSLWVMASGQLAEENQALLHFGVVPIILATFFGGWLSGISSYLVSALLPAHLPLDDLVNAVVLIPLLGWRVWRHKTHQVFYGALALLALGWLVLAAFRPPPQGWPGMLVTALAALASLAASYHALNFAERHLTRYFEMRDHATLDSLTGLNNRTSVDFKLISLHTWQKPGGVLLVDIDDFSRINEGWGRLAGDRVLTWLGEVLRQTVESDDFAGRYSGTTFIVITECHNTDPIIATAERIRQAMAARPLPLGGQGDVRVTVSIGAAVYLPGMVVHKAVEMAEEALGEAKRSGKNQVMCSRIMQLDQLGDVPR